VDTVTVYGGWSRGFRSGGFNQTGVGSVARTSGILGVNDLFDAEVADYLRAWRQGGVSRPPVERRPRRVSHEIHQRLLLRIPRREFDPESRNLDATYKGVELELSGEGHRVPRSVRQFRYTDSKITGMADPTVVGNQAPLVSKNTFNAGVQYHQPVGNGLNALLRLDYQEIGRTWWEPYNTTSRDPVNLLDARLGLETDKWSVPPGRRT